MEAGGTYGGSGSRVRAGIQTSLGSSVVLMAGLLMHELRTPLVLEFLASVIGYAFIKAFLKNYHSYYGILNGTESNV